MYVVEMYTVVISHGHTGHQHDIEFAFNWNRKRDVMNIPRNCNFNADYCSNGLQEKINNTVWIISSHGLSF